MIFIIMDLFNNKNHRIYNYYTNFKSSRCKIEFIVLYIYLFNKI